MNAAVSNTSADWQWRGSWNEFIGRVKRIWGNITDDDLDVAEGNFQEALGRIQRRTGEGLDAIQRKLST